MLHHLPSETLSSQRRRIKRDNGVHTFHIRLWFCKHPFHAVKTASETSWKFNNFVAREVFEIAARHTHARATFSHAGRVPHRKNHASRSGGVNEFQNAHPHARCGCQKTLIPVLRGDAGSVILNTSRAARAVGHESLVRVAFGKR